MTLFQIVSNEMGRASSMVSIQWFGSRHQWSNFRYYPSKYLDRLWKII